MTYRQPETPEQALVEAFYLELIAPGEGEAQAAALLVGQFRVGLDENTIAACRATALERFETDESDRA